MYFYEYVLGWRPEKPSNHPYFGQAVHLAKEHLLIHGYNAESMSNAYIKFNDYYRKEFPPETDPLHEPKTPARYMDMILEYIQTYGSDEQQYKVHYTEIGGKISLDGIHTLSFKMDSILEDNWNEGAIESMDHKTKKGLLSDWWKMEFPLSVQMGTYHHVLYCLYPPERVRGMRINGLGFKTTKANLFDLQRIPIYKDIEQMQLWQTNTIDWLDRLQMDFEWLSEKDTINSPIMHSFPLNPRSCTKYLGCKYHDFCLAWLNPLQRADQPPIGFKEEFWNPLELDLRWKFNVDQVPTEEIGKHSVNVDIKKVKPEEPKTGFAAIED